MPLVLRAGHEYTNDQYEYNCLIGIVASQVKITLFMIIGIKDSHEFRLAANQCFSVYPFICLFAVPDEVP